MQERYERNYWPHAIVGGIVFIVIACGVTIAIAVQNPVEMDSFYLEKYQSVDKNINEIMEKQVIFDEKYALEYQEKKLTIGKDETIHLKIKDKKSGEYLKNADITLMLTRPETNENNKEMKALNAVNEAFIFEKIQVNKPGRWQLLTRIKVGEFEGFNKYEVYATK